MSTTRTRIAGLEPDIVDRLVHLALGCAWCSSYGMFVAVIAQVEGWR
jgi:hypothetical protein